MSAPRTTAARAAWIGASMLAVFGLWLGVNDSAHAGIGFFYAIPIGFATWWFGPRAGAAVAIFCIGIYCLGAALDPVPSLGLTVLVRALAFAGIVAGAAALRKRVVLLEHDAEELEDIRAALAPDALPQLADVDAGAAFVPSDHGVSGDFYLLTNGPDGSTVAVVGDVVGHGPRAARLATFIRARLAAFAANSSDPAQILALANAALVERGGDGEELVSAACIRFQADGSCLSCAVAGHPPPLCLPSMVELDHEGGTMLLGVGRELTVATAELRLERSDGVLVYTDGATDVRQGDRLLGRDGLARLLSPLAGLPASALAREAQRVLLEWADGPIGDDLCLLVLRPKGG